MTKIPGQNITTPNTATAGSSSGDGPAEGLANYINRLKKVDGLKVTETKQGIYSVRVDFKNLDGVLERFQDLELPKNIDEEQGKIKLLGDLGGQIIREITDLNSEVSDKISTAVRSDKHGHYLDIDTESTITLLAKKGRTATTALHQA